MELQIVTFGFTSGESLTLTTVDAQWHSAQGDIVGHCTIEEFRDFAKQKRTDCIYVAGDATEANEERRERERQSKRRTMGN